MNEHEIRAFVSERKVNTDKSYRNIKTDKDRHALKRWNERVGPKMTKEELDHWVKIFHQLGEIRFVTDVFGYIRNEVVFAYKTENGKIIITTFYGRVSQKPMLQDILALREYNRTYNRLVDLNLDDGVLQKMAMPSVADGVFLYSKRNRTLYVEKYIADSGKELLFYWEYGKGFQEIQLDKPELHRHDRLILRFLKENGYASYVPKYKTTRR